MNCDENCIEPYLDIIGYQAEIILVNIMISAFLVFPVPVVP